MCVSLSRYHIRTSSLWERLHHYQTLLVCVAGQRRPVSIAVKPLCGLKAVSEQRSSSGHRRIVNIAQARTETLQIALQGPSGFRIEAPLNNMRHLLLHASVTEATTALLYSGRGSPKESTNQRDSPPSRMAKQSHRKPRRSKPLC